jgi:TPR repeat protein
MAIPKKLLDAAMIGDAQAQLEVGRLYAGGGAGYYDLEEAFRWFEKASDRDLPDAVLEVALAKEYGLGVDRDHEVAFAAYMRAARLYQGPLPFTIRGIVLTQGLCLARHRGQLSLAEAGYAHSQWSYVYGPKRKGNPTREVNPKKWLKRQAEAKKWTRRAAMLGYPPAFIDMSCLINRGEGEPGDVENLHGWYLKALEHDKSIAKLICKGSEPMTADWFSGRADPAVTGIVPRAESIKAWNRVWSESRQDRNGTSVDGMSAEAAKNLGDMHYRGKSGSEPDYVEAKKWYLCAAGRGCQWSMGQLAKMYLNGLGVARDAAKGFDWLDRQFAVVFCHGTKIVDERLLFHWALRPVVEGHLDHLDEDQLFAWLQSRTHASEPACAALSGGYDLTESSAAANHVCKAFRPDVFVKGKLDEATRKVVGIRVKRIKRLLARQNAAMVARAESGDAPSQFWHAAFFNRYKNRSGMALRWLLKSAVQGYSPAQHEVAKAYADGDGAPVSVDEARKWFKAASQGGHTWAQGAYIRVLAGTYYWGDYPKTPERLPSKEDLFEAYAWSIATEQRTNESDAWLKYSPVQVLAAYRRADEIRREIDAYLTKK